jgi:hypothetical protein
VQQAFYCNATHSQNYVAGLQALRTGDTEGGIRSLEMGLNAGVILMEPNEILESQTRDSVVAVLNQVAAYRAVYPWNGSPELKIRIERILSNAATSK